VKNPAEAQVEKFFQSFQIPLLEQNQQSKTLVYCYSMKKTALENCTNAEKMQEEKFVPPAISYQSSQ
jgi:hypothetical protein